MIKAKIFDLQWQSSKWLYKNLTEKRLRRPLFIESLVDLFLLITAINSDFTDLIINN
ncbi:hypothetical protein [Pleionea sediminis]|uniref:hypothetical protein n=1 Tax=Pleionea sediminis TaxID=2569479 RepID=UPI0013DDEE64|nr:hypothetical protein [Pleionea sediminis]